jgi:RNA polymerase sigma-70 factor, ECF subfamily
MGDVSDSDLVVQCLNGDSGAFDQLVLRYQLPMYRTALGIVGDPDAARDITQNGLVKSWEKLDTYDSSHRFYSWLYRIIINESLNHIRSLRRMEPVPSTRQDDQTPFQIMVDKEEHKRLHDAIARLHEDQRIVLHLRHFEELSYQEIAEVLQIEEIKVKSRLFSARLKLRELLVESREDHS